MPRGKLSRRPLRARSRTVHPMFGSLARTGNPVKLGQVAPAQQDPFSDPLTAREPDPRASIIRSSADLPESAIETSGGRQVAPDGQGGEASVCEVHAPGLDVVCVCCLPANAGTRTMQANASGSLRGYTG